MSFSLADVLGSIFCRVILKLKILVFIASLLVQVYQSNHSKVEAIPLSALPKDTTSELAGLFPH